MAKTKSPLAELVTGADVAEGGAAEAPVQEPIAPGTTKFLCTCPHTHIKDVEVEVKADAENPVAAAIEALRQKLGVWHFATQPIVVPAAQPEAATASA